MHVIGDFFLDSHNSLRDKKELQWYSQNVFRKTDLTAAVYIWQWELLKCGGFTSITFFSLRPTFNKDLLICLDNFFINLIRLYNIFKVLPFYDLFLQKDYKYNWFTTIMFCFHTQTNFWQRYPLSLWFCYQLKHVYTISKMWPIYNLFLQKDSLSIIALRQ